MQAIELLELARTLDDRIEENEARLDLWRHRKAEQLDGFAGMELAEEYGEAVAELMACLLRDIRQYTETYLAIEALLDSLSNPDYRRLLTLRYIDNLTMKEVAHEMNFSERYTYKLYQKALKAFEEVM